MATGDHVEVFREAARSGEERRYTKRFLARPPASTSGPGPSASGASSPASAATPGAPVPKALDLAAAPTRAARRACRRATPAPPSTNGRRWCRCAAARPRCATSSRTAPTGGRWRATACSRSTRSMRSASSISTSRPTTSAFPWAPAGAGRPLPGQPLAPRFKALALIDVAFSLVARGRLAGAAAAPARSPTTSTSRRAFCTRSRRAGAATSRRRARSTGAAISSASRRCSGATCPSSTTRAGSGWTAERHRAGAATSSASCSTCTAPRSRPLAAPRSDRPGRAAPARPRPRRRHCRPAAPSIRSAPLPLDRADDAADAGRRAAADQGGRPAPRGDERLARRRSARRRDEPRRRRRSAKARARTT